jgi:glycosyltransferase involved in cell wall biosynthesis
VPRVLNSAEMLGALVTDTWVSSDSLFGMKSIAGFARLRGRYHSELCSAPVRHFTISAMGFEFRTRLLRSITRKPWSQILARNRWFQRRGVKLLTSIAPQLEKSGGQVTLFAYSYAALELFRFAKQRGWRTVLGQIDGGWRDEEIVEAEQRLHPEMEPSWQPAPQAYWRSWKNECTLADRIIVNSEWSSRLLVEAGIESGKLHVIPVAYDASADSGTALREYPQEFTSSRPLRVLFLGQINLHKGVRPLLEVARDLKHENIEFIFVGPVQIAVPEDIKTQTNIKWIGPLRRSEVAPYYRDADVFILPTFSDGFGLTQLEAQAWKLPVIASRFCGDIVKDGINGVLLREISGEAIASVLLDFIRKPKRLLDMAAHSGVDDRFSLKSVASSLLSL